MADLATLIVSCGEQGRSRFASWRSEVFEDWALHLCPALFFADPLRARDLLVLLAEGVGLGLLGRREEPPASWLDGMLRGPVVPWLIEALEPERAPLLARVWNLGEGAGREAAFIDRYLLARLESFQHPATLSEDLRRELSPLLDAPQPATWQGPYRVCTLDLRKTDDRFLPGALHIVGPRLLAVSDRRRDVVLGVLLGPNAPSVLGTIALSAEGLPSGGFSAGAVPQRSVPPEIRWASEEVFIADHKVSLPRLLKPHTSVIAESGYLVATSENSQRLWVVCHD